MSMNKYCLWMSLLNFVLDVSIKRNKKRWGVYFFNRYVPVIKLHIIMVYTDILSNTGM